MSQTILLSHGSGGEISHNLISDLFVRYFDNEILNAQTDSAILNGMTENLSFTTDSYVIDPIFFPGGDIGKLAVCGTVNDLAVSGAKPVYLSVGFIIEEGFEYDKLEHIVASIASEARKAGVQIVTGDTKVVDRGKADKLYINTSGIGLLEPAFKHLSYSDGLKPGDKIIVNGTLGDHGVAIMAERENLGIKSKLKSDCASLNHLIHHVLTSHSGIRVMRDLTRGGLATILCELISGKEYGISIEEDQIPVKENVQGVCEILGLEPIYIANEGKVLMVVDPQKAESVVDTLNRYPLGVDAAIIGEIVSAHGGKVVMNTEVGGARIVEMLAGDQLPRIC